MRKPDELSIPALRLLAEVAAGDGLVRAARRLGLSQSGASHALAVLEKRLGATLAVRTDGVGLRLTEAGQRVLPHVRRVLTALEELRGEVAGWAALASGNLRIAAVPSVAGTMLPRLLREFHNRYPGIEVSLFEGTDGEVAEWCAQGAADIGFAALPCPGVSQHAITRDEWMAVVPATAKRLARGPVRLESLQPHAFLLSGGGCETHIRQLFRDSGLELPSYRDVKQVSTILAMVAEGLGVAIVPQLALQGLPKGARAVSLKPRRFRRVGFLLRDDKPHKPALKAWISLVRNHFAEA
jgi:DNA-binding transcriptional LysR family regulator